MHQLEHLPCPSPVLGREGADDSEHVLSTLAAPALEDSGTVGSSDLGEGVQVTAALAKRKEGPPPAYNESLLHPHLREVRTLGTLPPPLFFHLQGSREPLKDLKSGTVQLEF